MAIIIKTEEEIKKLREGGKRLAGILSEVSKYVKPGISTLELDNIARKLIEQSGDKPAFLGYTPEGVSYPYPAALCVSLNDEIVHGIPKENVFIKDGDVVTIDLGLIHDGMYTDHAITLTAGKVNKNIENLIFVTEESLARAIEECKIGNHVGDIGHAVESYAKKNGFKVIRGLSGHGVGKKVHEDPYIPNYGRPGAGEELKEGMVIAIEPMLSIGTEKIVMLDDEYTYVTYDGSISAHFEHTVYIGKNGPEILTNI